MTVLQRTDLTTSRKIQCAAAAVAGQHAHGSKTALSETYEISRPTVYAVGAAAESVLRSHFESPLLQGAAVDVRVDDAQLRRAVVALRVLAPNAIRPIEDLVPLLYPGVKVSYGTIQQMLVEAEGRAARFNVQVSLGGVEAGALDEMFSQGEPVLAGVDLDSGYLFGLSLSATRDGEAWAELLREGQCQGLELSVVVKDAARGIAAGVSEVFPQAEQRDDCFHVLYEMNKVRRRLERRAYGAIEREGEALGRLGKIRACDKVRRRKAKHALRRARRECAEAIERFDAFEAAMDTLRGALECVDINTGELHRPEHVQALIEGVAQRIESLGVGGVREAREVPAQPGAGVGAGAKERVASARGVGRAVVGAGGELGVPVLVLGPGAAQASCARPASCAVSSSARRLRGTARPTWRGERIAARGRRGGAAPAPSRLERHRGVQCGTAPLSLCAQRCYPRLSRPVPCLVQSAHAALGTAQGDQRSRVPDRTAGPRLAHAARLSALADTALIHGRCRALALLDTPRPRALRASGQAQLVCVKMNCRILIGAPKTHRLATGERLQPRMYFIVSTPWHQGKAR